MKIARLSVATAADEVAALRTRRRPNVNLQMLAGSLVAPLELTFERGSIGTFSATGPIPAADTRIGNDPQFTGFVFARVAQPLTQLSTIGWGVRALSVGEEPFGDGREERLAEALSPARGVDDEKLNDAGVRAFEVVGDHTAGDRTVFVEGEEDVIVVSTVPAI